MTFPLHSSRLLLRRFEERDALPFQRYRSDPEVARYQGWNVPYTLEQAQEFVAAELSTPVPRPKGQWLQLALAVRSTGEMIGDIAFYRLERDERQAEIGITLDRAHQGQGYASEAMTCLLEYLFGELGLHRVCANTDPRNTASARLLGRAGFRFEGRFVDSLWFKGEWASEDWYAILQREWEARSP
jgi:aminoglycoside 6'-N-acetyltransferase